MALVLSSFLACSLLPGLAVGRDDPLEVLCVVGPGSVRGYITRFGREPLTDAVVMPGREWYGFLPGTSPSDVRRMMRLYFPRSYEDMIERYEFILLGSVDASYFTSMQSGWLVKAIEDGGLGALKDSSVGMSGIGHSWARSRISEAFPVDADAVVRTDYSRHGPCEYTINEDPSLPPVLTPFKDTFRLSFAIYQWPSHPRLMIPMEGSQTYSWVRANAFREFAYPEKGTFPHVLGWRYGKGYTWCIADYAFGDFWDPRLHEYGPDVMFRMMMHSTGRDLPEDVVLVHRLKERFHEYAEAKSFIFSMMDFVEKFGANTNPLMEKVLGMDEKWERARRLYLSQDYEDSWSLFDQLLADVSGFRDDALRLKNEALFWIYVSEWLVVSGTFLLSSFVAWSLMVRRRLYKEVEQTRLRVEGVLR